MKDEKPGNKPETTTNQEKPVPTATPTTQSRRRLLKQLAVGGGVIAGSGALPDRWGRPLVQSAVLPAHATSTEPTTPTPTPALNQCGDGVDESFGSCGPGSITWTLDNFDPAGICANVTSVCDPCPGQCAISTNSQVQINATGFGAYDGQEVTAAWDSSQNPPVVVVAGGAFTINAGNISQGCDTLRVIRDPDGEDGGPEEICSKEFCGVPTGPCDPFTPT